MKKTLLLFFLALSLSMEVHASPLTHLKSCGEYLTQKITLLTQVPWDLQRTYASQSGYYEGQFYTADLGNGKFSLTPEAKDGRYRLSGAEGLSIYRGDSGHRGKVGDLVFVVGPNQIYLVVVAKVLEPKLLPETFGVLQRQWIVRDVQSDIEAIGVKADKTRNLNLLRITADILNLKTNILVEYIDKSMRRGKQ